MEIVDFTVNHVYPFWGSRDHLGQIFRQNQVEANSMNFYLQHFCTTNRYRAAAVHKIGDSNPRHTPPGSSKVKADGTVRKSVYEFLFESVKKNDVGGTVYQI